MSDFLDEEEGNITEVARWIPRLVVAGTLAGFLMLAWYAYRTGTQSIHDDDLMVVEADKTPMKEKPADPGGMKFPNQDKTIFETFANNPQPPKVERLMPPPEEPKFHELDTSDTKTWINEKLYKKEEEAAKAGQAAVTDAAKKPEEMVKPSPVEPARVPANNNVVSYTIDKTLALRAPQPAPAAAEAEMSKEPAKPAPEPKAAARPVVPVVKEQSLAKPPSKPASGKSIVQLGAYGSEKEAMDAFAKMQKKYSSLSTMDPVVVRADLGRKGVFYRLRVGGIADAKSFCNSLKGQACIPVQ